VLIEDLGEVARLSRPHAECAAAGGSERFEAALVPRHAATERVNELETVVGEFYVAFEPASSSSVSWLLGGGCSVVAAP